MIDPGIGNIHIKGKTVAKKQNWAYNNYRNELTISGQPKLNLKVTEHWEWRLLFSFYLDDFDNQHGNAKHDCEFFICRNRYHLLIMRFGFFTVNAVITEMANRLPCLNQLIQWLYTNESKEQVFIYRKAFLFIKREMMDKKVFFVFFEKKDYKLVPWFPI